MAATTVIFHDSMTGTSATLEGRTPDTVGLVGDYVNIAGVAAGVSAGGASAGNPALQAEFLIDRVATTLEQEETGLFYFIDSAVTGVTPVGGLYLRRQDDD
jgi:hypothetical protein